LGVVKDRISGYGRPGWFGLLGRIAVGTAGALVAVGAVPAVFPEVLWLVPQGLRDTAGPAATFLPHNGVTTFLLVAALNFLAAVLCVQAARERFLSPLTATYAILLAAVSVLIALAEAFFVSVGEAGADPAVLLLFAEQSYRAFRLVLVTATVPLWWMTVWALWHRSKCRHAALSTR
jgi:hypothetical protein